MRATAFTFSSTLILALAFALRGEIEQFPVERSESFQEIFPIDSGGLSVLEIEIDNLQGSIEVAGDGSDRVELAVAKRIRARSEERLNRAREEVRLDVSRSANRLRLFVDGPFRRPDGSLNYRGADHYGYEVTFDFALRVPRRSKLVAKTVNDGEIRLDGLAGSFDLENVNGGIAVTGASGSGRARAINGAVSVAFVENPTEASYFGSLNGNVDVLVGADLSARLMVKTFNGDLYTNLPTSYLPETPPVTVERRRGKNVHRTSGFYGLQVGSGGPSIELDAFNGDIRLLGRRRGPSNR